MRFVGEFCEVRNRPCFWARSGSTCAWSPGGCKVVIDECEGCDLIEAIDSKNYCSIFAYPRGQWVYGKCQRATHLQEVYVDPRKARNLNPLKSSKRKHRM